MREIFVELVGSEVVVYLPGSTEVAATKPSLEEALKFARAEWPALGIRVILSEDACELITLFPPKCAHCC